MQTVESGGEATPLALSFAELGARFGVSRTHVRSLLREAEAQGLVGVTSGQFVAAMPALVAAFDRFLAESMAGHDLIYTLALERHAGGEAPHISRPCRLLQTLPTDQAPATGTADGDASLAVPRARALAGSH
jgi:hypothetical protein